MSIEVANNLAPIPDDLRRWYDGMIDLRDSNRGIRLKVTQDEAITLIERVGRTEKVLERLIARHDFEVKKLSPNLCHACIDCFEAREALKKGE